MTEFTFIGAKFFASAITDSLGTALAAEAAEAAAEDDEEVDGADDADTPGSGYAESADTGETAPEEAEYEEVEDVPSGGAEKWAAIFVFVTAGLPFHYNTIDRFQCKEKRRFMETYVSHSEKGRRKRERIGVSDRMRR